MPGVADVLDLDWELRRSASPARRIPGRLKAIHLGRVIQGFRDQELEALETRKSKSWKTHGSPRPWSMDLGGHGLGSRYLAGQQTTRISITDLKKIQLLAQRRFNTR